MCVGETSSLLDRAHLAPDISLRVETLFASVVAGRRHGVENLPCRSIRQYSVDLERGCGWVGRLLESGGRHHTGVETENTGTTSAAEGASRRACNQIYLVF